MQDKAGEDSQKLLPSASDVIAGITSQSTSTPRSESSFDELRYSERFSKGSVEAEFSYVHLQGARDHYTHKGRWSWFLMAVVGGMIAFQSVLLCLVGFGLMSFTEYDWLLPALLAQNLGSVIGLAVYAVKFLFSDISRNPAA